MTNMKKSISVLLAVILLVSVVALAGCSKTEQKPETPDETTTASAENKSEFKAGVSNPVATINVKDYGMITVELYYDKAPNTVKNFISLANKGFYDGLTFHRVIEGFMIQGGCPNGNGTGGPGYAIKGEFANNGFSQNDIKHVRGTISMGRLGYNMDSAGSQFFICQEDYSYGDGDYAAFGMVTDGMDVVDKIAAVSTNSSDKPLKTVTIESITIDTHGIAYDEPETIPE